MLYSQRVDAIISLGMLLKYNSASAGIDPNSFHRSLYKKFSITLWTHKNSQVYQDFDNWYKTVEKAHQRDNINEVWKTFLSGQNIDPELIFTEEELSN